MPLSIGDFSAWVSIEGAKTECYATKLSEGSKTSSCWIASESGKRFCVHWADSVCAQTSSGYLTVDGIKCGGRAIQKRLLPTCVSASAEGNYTSRDTVQPFIFSAIKLTDDESSALPATDVEKIGEIKLTIRRVEVTPASETRPAPHTRGVSGDIHERAKKAGVHRTSYGAEEKTLYSPIMKARDFETIATFIFRYTSLEVLRARGTAPPLKCITDPPEDTKESSRQLEDRAELDNGVIDLLSDNDEGTTSLQNQNKRKAPADVKMEPSDKRIKRGPDATLANHAVEVIDLTLD